MTLKVVDEISACIPGHRKFSLQTDHSGMNKFATMDDLNFKKVCSEIERMAQGACEAITERFSGRGLISLTIDVNILH